MGAFKEPHGGELKVLYLDDATAIAEKQKAKDYKSWTSRTASFVTSI